MLRQAVLGQLPIITLRTRDTINVADVIRYTSGKPMIQWDGTTILQKALLFIWGGTALKEPWRLVYEKFTKAGSTLLVINPTNPIRTGAARAAIPPANSMTAPATCVGATARST
jgi:hypothetical protein